jgi:hypothetical protein
VNADQRAGAFAVQIKIADVKLASGFFSFSSSSE